MTKKTEPATASTLPATVDPGTLDPAVLAVLEANVDAQPALLGDLTATQLRMVHDVEEQKTDPRSTTLGHIHAELDNRKGVFENAKLTLADAAARAGIDLVVGEAGAADSGKDETIAALEAKIAELENRPAPKAATPKKQKAKKLALQEGKAKGEPRTVVFLDSDDTTLPDLPPLDFSPTQFARTGRDGKGSFVLTETIRLPAMVARPVIGGAMLLDDAGVPMAKLRLVTPLQAGGAGETVFAGKSLAFAPPTAPAK